MSEPLDDLRAYLDGLPAGPIAATSEFESLLAAAWGELRGGEADGMASYKLHGRTESSRWSPPFVEFEIERHGGTAMGSTRAERHRWRVDVEGATASCDRIGYRQLTPRAAPLKVQSLADQTAELIRSGVEHESLRWHADGSVTVRIGEVVSANGPQQTVAGRRKRYRQALAAELAKDGWTNPSANRFNPPA